MAAPRCRTPVSAPKGGRRSARKQAPTGRLVPQQQEFLVEAVPHEIQPGGM